MKDYVVYLKNGVSILVHADNVVYDSKESPYRDMVFFYVCGYISLSINVVDIEKIRLEICDDTILGKLMESVM